MPVKMVSKMSGFYLGKARVGVLSLPIPSPYPQHQNQNTNYPQHHKQPCNNTTLTPHLLPLLLFPA